MTTVKVQKNQIIAKQKEKVKKWYIVQEGTVIQCNSYAKIVLGKNAVLEFLRATDICVIMLRPRIPCWRCSIVNRRRI